MDSGISGVFEAFDFSVTFPSGTYLSSISFLLVVLLFTWLSSSSSVSSKLEEICEQVKLSYFTAPKKTFWVSQIVQDW